MAYWNSISNSIRPVITATGDGVNTAVPPRDIKDSQAVDMLNLDSHMYPALTTRLPKRHIGSSISGFTSLLMSFKNNKLLKIVGNKIYQLNNETWSEVGTIASQYDKYFDYTNFMDKLYIVDGNNKVQEISDTFSLRTVNNSPVAQFITSHANRLYVVYDNKLHYSGLREVDNWNTVDESGVIQIDTTDGEDLTALTTFSNHIICFSSHGTYELYGTGPINYEPLVVSNEIGCIANRSILEVNKNLMWLGIDGIYAYNGGTIPKKISWAVDKYIDRITKEYAHNACAGTDGRRYYIAIPVDGAQYPNIILSIDTELQSWYVHDIGEVVEYIRFNDELYYTDRNQVYKVDKNANEVISWYWESKPFSDGETARRVIWDKLYTIVDLPVGSTFKISLSLQDRGEEWTQLVDVSPSTNLKRHKILIPLGAAYNVDWVRIRLEGTGPCTIHEIQRFLRIKPW